MDRETVIRFGTYNIRNGRNRGLNSVLWGVYQANLNMGVFQDTKVTDWIHMQVLDG